jgi:hypothetical protein
MMPSDARPSKPDRVSSRYRGKAAKKKGWKSRRNKAPEKPEPKPVEAAEAKVRRRPEWQIAREAGAERQAGALAGLEVARATAADHHVEISVSMISLSRRGKPTVAHVRFLKDAQVVAHYHPAAGRLFFGRKAKIADEGRYETVEEATARVIAFEDANRAADDRFQEPAMGV